MTQPGQDGEDLERLRRADRILTAALDLPEVEREAFVRQEAASDEELTARVLRLLEAAQREDDGLETGALLASGQASQFLEELAEEEAVGRRIGPYRLLRPLGRGGSATVYLAERVDGEFDQQVAIKVLRAEDAFAEGVIERFALERQILAELRHPGIASLLDGGTTPWGRAYLVVEFIDGQPLDRYAGEHSLTLNQKLELILRIAMALRHAHRHLIVHRDIKPSNILVTADGQAKLLDFGIAKLLDSAEGAAAAQTGTVGMWMTPRYASPEQLLGDPVTTASDVYQLGLVLFELLTGEAAFDPSTTSPAALVDSARQREPARPGAVVDVPDDLDAIVAMATHPDSGRRYESVAAFAEDLEALKERRPVRARGDSIGYRVGVFLRRHRLAVGAASLALLAGAVFTAGITWSFLRAERERQRAEAISEFLESTLNSAQPYVAKGRDTALLQAVLADASARIESELAGRPEAAADLHRIVAGTYRTLADPVRAQHHAALAASGFEAQLGPDAEQTLTSRQMLGMAYWDQGLNEEAERELSEVLELAEKALGEDHPVTALTTTGLGLAIRAQGRLADALPLYESSVVRSRLALGDASQETIAAIGNLAFLLAEMDRLDEAEPHAKQAADLSREHLGPDNPDTYLAIDKLGSLISQRGRLDEAIPLHREAIEGMRRLLGEEHSTTLGSGYNMAILLRRLERYDEAIETIREVETIVRAEYGTHNPFLFRTLLELGRSLMLSGRPAQARPHLEESLKLGSEVLSPDHYSSALISISLAEAHIELGDRAAAGTLLRDARRILEETFGAEGTHRHFDDLVRVEQLLGSRS